MLQISNFERLVGFIAMRSACGKFQVCKPHPSLQIGPQLATEMCASKLEIHYIFTAQRWVKKGLLGNVFPLNLFEDEGNNVGCQLGSVLKI